MLALRELSSHHCRANAAIPVGYGPIDFTRDGKKLRNRDSLRRTYNIRNNSTPKMRVFASGTG
jgi:hypothetical protein